MPNQKVKVLFVCMGNICRSPTAHGIFENLVNEQNLNEKIEIDSAGTINYHEGEAPDLRSQKTAKKYGLDISHLRARHINTADFAYFDYILAMDHDNFVELKARCPSAHQHKIKKFLEYNPNVIDKNVPDPYYGGPDGFDLVFQLCKSAATNLLNEIKTKL